MPGHRGSDSELSGTENITQASLQKASFQDGYFQSGDETHLDYLLSNNRDDYDGGNRNKSKDDVQSSKDRMPSSYHLWAPYNNHSETSPPDTFTSSSLGVNSSEYWSSSSFREKDSTFTSNSRHMRGPLDIGTSPISSPVSSSEDSIKAKAQDGSTLESHWKYSAPMKHCLSENTLNVDRFRSNGFNISDEEGKVRHQQMLASLELANRLANRSSDAQRTYSAVPSISMTAKLDPNSLWYSGQQSSFDGEGIGGAHLQSIAASIAHSTSESSQYRQYQSEQGIDHLGLSSLDTSPEFSIFVGDLSPDLREEDLLAQFLHPSAWPASHPFAIAHAHAQQTKGDYTTPAKIRPAPFTSTKSAKIMKDPLTGVSRGFGFVRFSNEEDCARALVEMQGMVVYPLHGSGRPLRVCTATPKNRGGAQPAPSQSWGGSSLSDALNFYKQLQLNQDRLTSPAASSLQEQGSAPMTSSYNKSTAPDSFSPTSAQFYGQVSGPDSMQSNDNLSSYSNSALDPNNTTVFVGGLSSLISEDTLKTFFAPFGEIIYVKIPPGKGCGFVQFVKKMDAERAIERMQGFPIGGGRIRLSWGRSQGDKAAAAAAQVVAQTAQINQLASLAGLSSMTPAQLNHLTAVTSTPRNDSDAQFYQRLASLTASSRTSNREKESLDLQRAASIQHLPAMELQHRQAQRQAFEKYSNEASASHSALHTSLPTSWSHAEKYNVDALRGTSSDDYLASLLPSLRLEEAERNNLSASQYSRHTMTSPMSFDGRSHNRPSSQAAANKVTSLKDSSIFSPFSPQKSPSTFDEPNSAHYSTTNEIRQYQQGNDSDSAFLRYLEIDRQQQQQQESANHRTPTTSQFVKSSIANSSET